MKNVEKQKRIKLYDPKAPKIESFSGKYHFLSNFFPVEELDFKTVEHPYQAEKIKDPVARQKVLDAATPGLAKRIARTIAKAEAAKANRSNLAAQEWDSRKVSVMKALLKWKFSAPIMRQALIETYPSKLIEGNTWGDTFWGRCDGVGKNMLGKLLMRRRRKLIEKEIANGRVYEWNNS